MISKDQKANRLSRISRPLSDMLLRLYSKRYLSSHIHPTLRKWTKQPRRYWNKYIAYYVDTPLLVNYRLTSCLAESPMLSPSFIVERKKLSMVNCPMLSFFRFQGKLLSYLQGTFVSVNYNLKRTPFSNRSIVVLSQGLITFGHTFSVLSLYEASLCFSLKWENVFDWTVSANFS